MGLWSFLRGTTSNILGIGDGVDSDKKIEANVPGADKPALRFNHTFGKWEISHDGTTFQDLSGLMQKSSNLSDVANALTAFGNIKQAASPSVSGVIELATDAEVLTGTDTERGVTPANIAAACADERSREAENSDESIFYSDLATEAINSIEIIAYA